MREAPKETPEPNAESVRASDGNAPPSVIRLPTEPLDEPVGEPLTRSESATQAPQSPAASSSSTPFDYWKAGAVVVGLFSAILVIAQLWQTNQIQEGLLAVETKRVEGTLLLESVTSTPAQSRTNLLFLVNSGIVSDSDGRIRAAVANLSDVPVLPLAGTAPRTDIKVNGSDGPVTVTGEDMQIEWVSTNATACKLSLPPSTLTGVTLSVPSITIEAGHPWYPPLGIATVLALECGSEVGDVAADFVIVRHCRTTASCF